MKQKIILTDHNLQYRNTVKTIINSYENAIVIGEASEERELMRLLDIRVIPDIIFTEIILPGMNGIELTKKVLQKYPNIIVIGLASSDNQQYIDSLIRAGAKGFLYKLSNNEKLFESIFDDPTAGPFFSDKILQNKKKKKTKKTVLVVDDFETNTYVIGLTLSNANYHVIKAETGTEGLKIAQNPENDLDIIVADYNMPDMNGAEMIKKIRDIEKYKNIPALILSSDKSPEKKKFAEDIGISAWIQKPFQLDRFIKIINRAVK